MLDGRRGPRGNDRMGFHVRLHKKTHSWRDVGFALRCFALRCVVRTGRSEGMYCVVSGYFFSAQWLTASIEVQGR